ncbi:uncharacterized protein [Sagmatias obliquidens]|uniref:uncharacterized protein n=1 Tax=Sagmatias obliquidens TaxID=3371155 RepID=UPI000F444E76|nr:uncharacterized protein LOC113616258 [Lagenorhynchus obliquidens]
MARARRGARAWAPAPSPARSPAVPRSLPFAASGRRREASPAAGGRLLPGPDPRRARALEPGAAAPGRGSVGILRPHLAQRLCEGADGRAPPVGLAEPGAQKAQDNVAASERIPAAPQTSPRRERKGRLGGGAWLRPPAHGKISWIQAWMISSAEVRGGLAARPGAERAGAGALDTGYRARNVHVMVGG